MRTVDIITMGCSKNLIDSEQLLNQFQEQGFIVYHNPEKTHGDIAVVNTCGFIADAKEESIEMILELCELKEARKLNHVFVMGCLSERYRTELLEEIPEIDRIYGKFDWKQILADLGHRWDDSLKAKRFRTTPSHYEYIKIGEGCNRMCAYCAIPLITGRYKSRPIEEIVEEIRTFVANGVHEFQLIAQDLTGYGKDLYGRFNIAELVEQIAQIPGVEWIRLHYAYPNDFPLDLLPVMAKYPNVCKYLDIALQHASDHVLDRMLRHVTCKETEELLARIRKEVPGIHLRTTLMVGFPGETEEDFEFLVDFVKRQRFERMGAFAYSEEDGTYSARHYEDDVPADVKQSRLDALMAVQEEITTEIQEEKVGKVLKVVIDREEGDYYVGRTEYDSPEVDLEVLIAVDSCEMKVGKFYNVKIKSASVYELIGELVNE